MRINQPTWIATLIFALAATILLQFHQTTTAQTPTTTATHEKWEYASLMTSARLSKWTSARSQYIQEGDQGYVHLYSDMGGKKPADKISLIDLLNLAGDQGWELVAIDGGDGPHQYIFKRLVQ